MKKGLISMGILAAFIFTILVVSGVFAQAPKAKDEYILKNSYGDVKFNHKNHVEKVKLDCKKCHHTGDYKTCDTCHKASKEASKDAKGITAKDAFHKDCKGCHEEAKKANKPAGPTTCTTCHKKEKK